MLKQYEFLRSTLALRQAQDVPSDEYSRELALRAERYGPDYNPGTMISIDDARQRRSRRPASGGAIQQCDLAELLYLALFATDGADGLRPYPAAGGLYSTHLYVAALNVDGIDAGTYYVRWCDRILEEINTAEAAAEFRRSDMYQLDQESIPCIAIIMLETTLAYAKYGHRAFRFGLLEAGALMQTLYLAGEKVGLNVSALGLVCDRTALSLCKLPAGEQICYATSMSIGNR
jgi:SagB-type dehydrogenase family enzyme